MVINKGRRSKTQNEVKPVKYIPKNPQSYLIISCKNEVPPSHKLQDHVHE